MAPQPASASSDLNPLDHVAHLYWWFFGIFILFAKSLFKAPEPSAIYKNNGKGGPGGGGPGNGPRIHRVQPPMGRMPGRGGG